MGHEKQCNSYQTFPLPPVRLLVRLPHSLAHPHALTSSQPGSPGASLPPLSPEVCKDVEREADQLFRSHTVEEIKSIARDKRLEIDRRREDLRQMVG